MRETFTWRRHTLTYLDHPYNTTILNERAVEVPIATQWLRRRDGDGLEVGNVLAHYGDAPKRRVVDLYEEDDGVDNVDVLTIDGSYDWIVAISTLEHVWWEKEGAGETRWEDEDTPEGPLLAMRHLLGLLRPGGRMLVTTPFGQHPYLDGAILSGCLGTDQDDTLTYEGDHWEVHPWKTVWRPARERRWAGAVWIGTWSNF